jgi:CubicO group peptidase (beta-lactamase class C family)
MNRLKGLLAAFAFLGAAGAAQAEDPRSLAELDARLGRMIADGHIPGASIAIVEHGQVVLTKGYGYADVARHIRATADTPFRAGSISKSFTAVAVMTLVEQKRLDLDAPIAKLVPEVRFVNPWEKTDPVRLVNLLEHTTGWPDISTRVLSKDGKGWSTLQGLQFTMAEFTSRWQPGRFTVYNNAGPAVAGFAIEKVTGETYDQYMRDAVLRPLGMAKADFDFVPDLAKSYAPGGAETPYQYIVLKPAGSLNISARELAQMVRFYLGRGTVDGRRILSPASVERIERSETDLGAKYGFHNAYALGNAPFPDSGITFRGHNGSIDSFTAVMGYSLRNGSGYVLMANGGEGVDFATPIAHLMQSYLTRSLPLDPPPAVKVPQAELDSYAGYYRTITPPNALLRPYGEIIGITHVEAGDGKLIVSGNDWLPTGPHSFRRADREAASLAFVTEGGHTYKIGAFNAQIKEPFWRILGLWITGALIVLGTLIGIVMTIVPPIVGVIRRRPAFAGTWPMRLVPLAAFAALVATYFLPIYAYALSGATAVTRLAEITPYSTTIFAVSILFPLLSVLGLVLAIRASGRSRFVRAYTGLTSLGLIAAAAYTALIGWVPLMTWRM